ncbi:MAG: hypothetical protein Q9162_006660 [Coniocarpon cinnabarinum]
MANLPPRARPAHAPGPTFLTYTPNGRKLITVGSNDALRVFVTGSDDEPVTIDDARDSNLAVAATDDFFVTGSEDGSVCKFSLDTNMLDQVLVRCSMPVRDLALSPNGQWLAVASDDVVIKIVDTENMQRLLQIGDLPKPAKHVAFNPSGDILTASCADGVVYFYSMKEEQPELIRKIDGLVRAVETDDEASVKAEWHPDGRAFAAATATRGTNTCSSAKSAHVDEVTDIQVVSRRDWANQRLFKGHAADVTTLAWSPNGAFLASASKDGAIHLWETRTQRIIHRSSSNSGNVLAFSWHPTEDILSYTNSEGELYIHGGFVGQEYSDLLQKELQPAPFIHDPLGEVSGNAQRGAPDQIRQDKRPPPRPAREATPDSLDDLRDFIEDDENAHPEYAGGQKRSGDQLEYPISKRARHAYGEDFGSEPHPAFQPGATPWMGDRRYLTSNLLGLVWTVDHNTSSDSISAEPHRTVTVEFYDRSFQRDFHFTDLAGYDLASLSEKGALFAAKSRGDGKGDKAASVYFRPHEHWTTSRPDWRMHLPQGEEPLCIALTDSYVVTATDRAYIRLYTHGGTPVRIWRLKSFPIVALSSFRDYLFIATNGATTPNNTTELRYSIHALRRDDLLQNSDLIPIPPRFANPSIDDSSPGIHNAFFSSSGDPCVYDSTGTLLVLIHWRDANRANWTPLLDTNQLDRKRTGRKDERYWPLGVADQKFYCFILKGGDLNPSIYPRPLVTDFDFAVPIISRFDSSDEVDTADRDARSYEESWVRCSLLYSLHSDLLESTHATRPQREELAAKESELDVLILRLIGAICSSRREEEGMRALETAGLIRDVTGGMMEKAGLIAGRFGMDVLRGKLGELAEARVVGLDGGDE